MTEQSLATVAKSDIIERVLLAGDLSRLTPTERTSYYMRTCESLGLNPMTRPFEYITLNGKLTLYARKDATDQLRNRDKVSIGKPDITFQDDLIIVAVEATNAAGRKDSDIGVVKKSDMRGDVANALMKAVTKAKRRVTLSICGLGMLDETEVETIPDAKPFVDPLPREAVEAHDGNGHKADPATDADQAQPAVGTMEDFQVLFAKAKELGLKPASVSVGTKPDVLAKICADLRGKINAKLDAEAMAA